VGHWSKSFDFHSYLSFIFWNATFVLICILILHPEEPFIIDAQVFQELEWHIEVREGFDLKHSLAGYIGVNFLDHHVHPLLSTLWAPIPNYRVDQAGS
jgi:hypothetical protein